MNFFQNFTFLSDKKVKVTNCEICIEVWNWKKKNILPINVIVLWNWTWTMYSINTGVFENDAVQNKDIEMSKWYSFLLKKNDKIGNCKELLMDGYKYSSTQHFMNQFCYIKFPKRSKLEIFLNIVKYWLSQNWSTFCSDVLNTIS